MLYQYAVASPNEEYRAMKFTPGPAISAASGSIGGTVFSRNRFGAYTRTRAIPITSTTIYAQNAKAILSAQSQAWAGLTAAQRLAWKSWAQTHPVTDNLGQSQNLTGHQAYVQINSRLDFSGGTLLALPPVADAPDALTSLTATFDIGTGDFEVVFTPTPLPTGVALWSQAAVVSSAGVTYIKNLLKQVDIQAAASTSPVDLQSAIETRFGPLQVGQAVHIWCRTYDTTTGLVSEPLTVSGLVVST